MVQEIITCLIIACAVAAAVYKTAKALKRKSRKAFKNAPTAGGITHNCDTCPADCSLRDSVSTSAKQCANVRQKQKIYPL